MESRGNIRVNRNPNIEPFGPGDSVKVSYRVREGERERTQVFQGVVIKRRGGTSIGANFTVRRIAQSIGVERTFPLGSPLLERVEVIRRGAVRRARLYYLKKLVGRAARIKERVRPRRYPELKYAETVVEENEASVAEVGETETVIEENEASVTEVGETETVIEENEASVAEVGETETVIEENEASVTSQESAEKEKLA